MMAIRRGRFKARIREKKGRKIPPEQADGAGPKLPS
jgi:hypothetical protein